MIVHSLRSCDWGQTRMESVADGEPGQRGKTGALNP